LIRSVKNPPSDFGTLMQMFMPVDFRGKRVRLSAWNRTENVEKWCGLWMRVDGPDREYLAFDNMQSRPIVGSTDWTRYEVVHDCASNAGALAFGILLVGNGAAWLDDVAFDLVGNDVPSTGESTRARARVQEHQRT
jgi:hypothetical protein